MSIVRLVYTRLPLAFRDRVRWLRWPLRAVVMLAWRTAPELVVKSGPFRGMRLPRESTARLHPPYVLGTQELELHGAIEHVAQTDYATVVNVGGGDGYYAVGLALRLPRAGVIVFEQDADRRAALAAVARANGVASRADIRGFCTLDVLAAALRERTGRALVLADIEGAEDAFFSARAVPVLNGVDMIVETHDTVPGIGVPGTSARLRERFAATHTIEEIESRDRRPEDIPGSLGWWSRLSPRTVVGMMSEQRGTTQSWLVMRARA